MQQLPITLDTLAENLSLDEALLEAAEAGELPTEVLRLWEATDYGIVLGRSSPVETEVHLDACRVDRIPVLRRASGGGTIVAGPGCLMYAVVLDLDTHPQLRAIDAAHCHVLGKLARMLSPLVPSVEIAGSSDLTFTAEFPRKFSGNAMRLKRKHLLYHGTLLYDFDLERISRWLATPTRAPDYRQQRAHAEFVANLPLPRRTIVETLIEGWQAGRVLSDWPVERTSDLVRNRYATDPQWVFHQPQS